MKKGNLIKRYNYHSIDPLECAKKIVSLYFDRKQTATHIQNMNNLHNHFFFTLNFEFRLMRVYRKMKLMSKSRFSMNYWSTPY